MDIFKSSTGPSNIIFKYFLMKFVTEIVYDSEIKGNVFKLAMLGKSFGRYS